MLAEGTYIADRYEIVSMIGQGGMSDVYKAKDHKLGRFVAIKILKQEFANDVNFVSKFRTEAQAAASLEHPNIVNIYDVGSENGLHYIVMEYVEGITLKDYISRKGQLSFKESVSIAIQVGRGIEAAHNKNITHRDIKPQNIIISTEGKVKVTDFGIARAATSNTINADVMGSVHYTSPEQARNGFVDGRSDIYSLGIVMYEMVTGRVPFDGDTAVAVAIQHLQEEMVIPSTYAANLPISMEKIILKCTQKSPDRRYQTMGELLIDLRRSLETPDLDFVKMIPLNNQEKTRVITAEEVDQIKQEAERYPAQASRQKADGQENLQDTDAQDAFEDELAANGILNPKMEKAVTVMGIVAAIIIVGVIIYFAGAALGIFKSGSSHKNNTTTVEQEDEGSSNSASKSEKDKDKVAMIDLSGMTIDEAKDILEQKGLDKVNIKEMGTTASDKYEKGQIVSQTPAKGDKIGPKETIRVVISGGPEVKEVTVPSGLVGMKTADAVEKLKNAGLGAEEEPGTREYSDSIPNDCVIRVTPGSGSTLSEGSSVVLVISKGPENKKISVPDVSNMSEDEARAAIQGAGLVVGSVTTENSDSVAEGQVTRTDPGAGAELDSGSSVNLFVSAGAKSHTYRVDADVYAPDDGHNYVRASAVLTDKNGKNLLSNDNIGVGGNGAIHVSASNIQDSDSGTISVTWYYEDTVQKYDDNGQPYDEVESGQNKTSQNVTFTQE